MGSPAMSMEEFYEEMDRVAIELLDDAVIRGEIEDYQQYREGGYCPIQIGKIYHDWLILRKLSFDAFSTTWMVKSQSGAFYKYATMKVRKATVCAEFDAEEFLHDVLIKAQPELEHLPVILDSFFMISPNGKHRATIYSGIFFDFMTTIRQYPESSGRKIPYDIGRFGMQEVTKSLMQLHELGFAHGDVSLASIAFHIPHPKPIFIPYDPMKEVRRPWKMHQIVALIDMEKGGETLTVPKKLWADGRMPPVLVAAAPIDKALIAKKTPADWSIKLFNFYSCFQNSGLKVSSGKKRLQSKRVRDLTTLSPETAFCNILSAEADMWSLGILSYNLITSRTLCEMLDPTDHEDFVDALEANVGPMPPEYKSLVMRSRYMPRKSQPKLNPFEGLEEDDLDEEAVYEEEEEDPSCSCAGYKPKIGSCFHVKFQAPQIEGSSSAVGRRIFELIQPSTDAGPTLYTAVLAIMGMLQYDEGYRLSAIEVLRFLYPVDNDFEIPLPPIEPFDVYEMIRWVLLKKRHEFEMGWDVAIRAGRMGYPFRLPPIPQPLEPLQEFVDKQTPRRVHSTAGIPLKPYEYRHSARLHNTTTDPKGADWPLRNWSKWRVLPPQYKDKRVIQ